jgi:hypothetical protein
MIADLYERHLFESNGTLIIRDGDNGFASYKITGDECFLHEIYVVPDKRQNGIAGRLIAAMKSIARSANCKMLTANIFLEHLNSNETTKAALAVGFRIVAVRPGPSLNTGTLFLSMEVG